MKKVVLLVVVFLFLSQIVTITGRLNAATKKIRITSAKEVETTVSRKIATSGLRI